MQLKGKVALITGGSAGIGFLRTLPRMTSTVYSTQISKGQFLRFNVFCQFWQSGRRLPHLAGWEQLRI